jgi:hypothetical protein
MSPGRPALGPTGGPRELMHRPFFPVLCNTFGATDLCRYSAMGTPNFTTSPSPTSYLSIVLCGLPAFGG